MLPAVAPRVDLTSAYEETRRQVELVVRDMSPTHDMQRIDRLFALVARACAGRLDGYQKLQTLYHNDQHMLEVVLCATRLLHGVQLSGRAFSANGIDMAIMGALLHDIGYLKRDDEEAGTGAQFTATHVQRGTEFARRHLTTEPAPFLAALVNVILITDHRLPVDRLAFGSAEEELAAKITGTADLVGQMANREYLERLLLLFFEFQEAGMGNFADFDALLEGTAAFYRLTRERLDGPLGGLSPYLARHFAKADGAPGNHYQEAIDKNLAYLGHVLEAAHGHRIERLKRGGLVQRALERLAQ